jgi:hypothetical protein
LSLNQLLTSAIAKLMPPVLLLAAGLWAIFTITAVPPTWQTLLVQALPVTAIATAMLLSIQFNRSRYSLLLLFVALAGLSQTWLRGHLLPATGSATVTLRRLIRSVYGSPAWPVRSGGL